MEAASSIKDTLKEKVNVTVVERNPTPFYHALGEKVGKGI